jgi:hypothetical protein
VNQTYHINHQRARRKQTGGKGSAFKNVSIGDGQNLTPWHVNNDGQPRFIFYTIQKFIEFSRQLCSY